MGYRHKMEIKLGRLLTSDEIVHHINFNHSDNRIENLQLMTRSEHATLHRKGVRGRKSRIDGTYTWA